MTFVVSVAIEVAEISTQAVLVRVGTNQTVQVPGGLQQASGDLFAAVLERMTEAAKEEAMEQARQMTKQTP